MPPFSPPPKKRRISLTPMIDVVFLLLVFFMLASRFNLDTELVLSAGASSNMQADYTGPPRYIELRDTTLTLNGFDVAPQDLVARLNPLMTQQDDAVLIKTHSGPTLQTLVDVMQLLSAADINNVILVP